MTNILQNFSQKFGRFNFCWKLQKKKRIFCHICRCHRYRRRRCRHRRRRHCHHRRRRHRRRRHRRRRHCHVFLIIAFSVTDVMVSKFYLNNFPRWFLIVIFDCCALFVLYHCFRVSSRNKKCLGMIPETNHTILKLRISQKSPCGIRYWIQSTYFSS